MIARPTLYLTTMVTNVDSMKTNKLLDLIQIIFLSTKKKYFFYRAV